MLIRDWVSSLPHVSVRIIMSKSWSVLARKPRNSSLFLLKLLILKEIIEILCLTLSDKDCLNVSLV